MQPIILQHSHETADISGKEQLSLAVRYMETNSATPSIHEEFLGYVHIHQVTAEAIANALLESCLELAWTCPKWDKVMMGVQLWQE